MIDVQIDGLAELNKVLTDLAKQYPKQVLKGCADTGFVIETEAKKLCPVGAYVGGSGNLRSSIRTNVDKDKGEVTVTAGGSETSKDVGYAVYVEYGTGMYATGPGGSRATKLPWVYHTERSGFITTFGNPPRPFMRPAADVGLKRLVELVKKAIDGN